MNVHFGGILAYLIVAVIILGSIDAISRLVEAIV